MASGSSFRKGNKVKHAPARGLGSSKPITKDFTQLYFPHTNIARRFNISFMGKMVTPSYFIDIYKFGNIIICRRLIVSG